VPGKIPSIAPPKPAQRDSSWLLLAGENRGLRRFEDVAFHRPAGLNLNGFARRQLRLM
jgi:hypothetical protein